MNIFVTPKICLSNNLPDTEHFYNFDVVRIDGVPCAYCGKDMPTNNFLNNYFNSDAQANIQMLEHALKLRYILPSDKQVVIDTLRELQISQSLATDNQVFDMAKFKFRKGIKEDVLKKFNEIAAIISESDDNRLKLLMAKKGEKFKERLSKNPSYISLGNFVNICLYNGYFNVTQNETHSKIASVISDIYKGGNKYIMNRILKKYMYRTARDFYMDLFRQTIPSVDHVIPKSKGGSDKSDNFLSVCKACNVKKSNMPFPLFIKTYPNVKENIKKQLVYLKRIIPYWVLKRKLDVDYLDYPEEVSKTLSKITDGAIDIVA